MLSQGCLHEQGKGGRIIRPCEGWEWNLDWGPDDVLELTLGEAGTAVHLDRDSLQSSALPRVWKV
jgi:hypothetical protein